MKKIFVKKEPPIPFTKKGYEKVLAERKEMGSQRPDAVEHLRKSREMGDLSENGYYKASRQRLNFVDAQIRRLDRLIKLGIVVESKGNDSVEITSTVVITDGSHTFTYTIVGGYESNPSNMTISYISPIGKALMKKRVGETVEVQTPVGVKKFTILEIR